MARSAKNMLEIDSIHFLRVSGVTPWNWVAGIVSGVKADFSERESGSKFGSLRLLAEGASTATRQIATATDIATVCKVLLIECGEEEAVKNFDLEFRCAQGLLRRTSRDMLVGTQP